MTVLLIGGAGYLGVELAYKLTHKKNIDEIIIYDSLIRQNPNVFNGLRKFNHTNIKFVESDLLDSRSLEPNIEKADIIINLAAQVPTKNSGIQSHHFEQINNWGSAIISDLISKYKNKRVIHISSLSVFGEGEIKSLENPQPIDFYGTSKLRGERHFIRLSKTTLNNVSIIRSPSIYGYSKNLRIDSAINRMIFDANFKNKIMISGDPEFSYPHIEINLLIKFIIDAISKENQLYIYPKFSNLNANLVYDSLKNINKDLEIIYIDQGVYKSSLEFDESIGLTENKDKKLLEDEIQNFLNSFTF